MARHDSCPRCGMIVPADPRGGLCPDCDLRRVFLDGISWHQTVSEADSNKKLAVSGLTDEWSPGQAEAERAGVAVEASALKDPLPRLGDYQLLRVLGRGGMGVVYEAHQGSLDRKVALKLIRSGQLASESDLLRFRTEAEVIARMDHPHVVPVYEVGEHEGHHYFSMRLLDGGDLSRHLCRFPADPRASVRLTVQIARAVQHAHRRGVLHRDLKPSNILLDADGRPQISDFGLAKRIEDADGLTVTGQICGSPPYMAPEQLSGERAGVTTATDIYGLGAILYALLTGGPPFRGGSLLETLDLVRQQLPEPPSRQNGRIDRDLETICLKCLEKDPGRRYDSADGLADELERWLAGMPIRATPIRPWARVWRWARRRPSAAALAVILGLASIGLVGAASVAAHGIVVGRLREARLRSALDSLFAEIGRGWETLRRDSRDTLPPGPSGEPPAPGVLYLPHPFIAPGGRFREMYGWDSYFIEIGLLRAGKVGLARQMVENCLYEVDHYGKILNANHTDFLTRSQPPFLTRMILGVYRELERREPEAARAWLAETVPRIEAYHRYWTEGPRLVPETGLSRYLDEGTDPAPEVLSGARDRHGKNHYDLVVDYFNTYVIRDYDVRGYFDGGALTPSFYRGDRSMRESGFNPTDRFGPFGVEVVNYNPVCLNSLLFVMESDTTEILETLGRAGEAKTWRQRADKRRETVNALMWDDSDGLYYDFQFAERRLGRYPFLTTFYPLWAGIADSKRAARVAANLPLFERAGGLQTSTNESGGQWDAPFGSAPLHLIAVQGLRRYGNHEAADRIAAAFLSMVLEEFIEHDALFEKYDVVRRDSSVELRFGYTTNETGFGWTNAVFLELYDELRQRGKHHLVLDQAGPALTGPSTRASPPATEPRHWRQRRSFGGTWYRETYLNE